MTPTVFQIFSIALAAIALVACFFPRTPAVLAAWLGLLSAHFAGAPYITGKVLTFWAVASVIVLMLDRLQPTALARTRSGLGYVAAGAIAGTAVGYACAPVVASFIIGAIAGAFLGTVAFMTLPGGPKKNIGSPEFIQYLCAKGLPAVVSCSQAAIVLASTL